MSVAISQDAADDHKLTTASYDIVTYPLGKHMKPFTDTEVVKECFISASNLLFDNISNHIGNLKNLAFRFYLHYA